MGRGNFSVGMKQLTNTDYVVRLHLTSYYFQRPLEEARQISTRNDKDVFLAGLGEMKLNDLLRSLSEVL